MKDYEMLLVDDEANTLEVTASILEEQGYKVTTESSGEAAIEALGAKRFDLVLTDINMPRGNGFAVLKKAKELQPGCPVIMLTGSQDVTLPVEALRLGADDYLFKPFSLSDLLARVDACLEKPQRKQEHTALQAHHPASKEHSLNEIRLALNDMRSHLVYTAAGIRMLNQGVYGKMDDNVASVLNTLLARILRLIGTVDDSLGKGFPLAGGWQAQGQTMDMRV